MNWHKLKKGRDRGGVRWYLGGEPISCGTPLLLRLPAGRSVPVGFEMSGGEPVLTLLSGCEPYVDSNDGKRRDDGCVLTCRVAPEKWEYVELAWPERWHR